MRIGCTHSIAAPALKSTLIQCVDDDVINIWLLYDSNTLIELELWDGNFHSISLYRLLKHLASDSKNIKDLIYSISLLNILATNKSTQKSNNIQGIGEIV